MLVRNLNSAEDCGRVGAVRTITPLSRGVMVSAKVFDSVDRTCVLHGDRPGGLPRRSREGTFASGPGALVDAVCCQELHRGKSVSRTGYGLKRLLTTCEARAGMLRP